MFNQDVIAAVKAAEFCRVVITRPFAGRVVSVYSWRWQTRAQTWLVIDTIPEQVAEAVERLRGTPVQVLRGAGRL